MTEPYTYMDGFSHLTPEEQQRILSDLRNDADALLTGGKKMEEIEGLEMEEPNITDCDNNNDPVWRDEQNQHPLDIQIGGDHYKDFKIQPVEFITKNRIQFLEGCIIKRICRYNISGGKGIEDLNKIKHEVDLIIALQQNLYPCKG
jgi:hypothetical protein